MMDTDKYKQNKKLTQNFLLKHYVTILCAYRYLLVQFLLLSIPILKIILLIKPTKHTSLTIKSVFTEEKIESPRSRAMFCLRHRGATRLERLILCEAIAVASLRVTFYSNFLTTPGLGSLYAVCMQSTIMSEGAAQGGANLLLHCGFLHQHPLQTKGTKICSSVSWDMCFFVFTLKEISCIYNYRRDGFISNLLARQAWGPVFDPRTHGKS